MATNYFLQSFFTGVSVGIQFKGMLMESQTRKALEEAGQTLGDAEGQDLAEDASVRDATQFSMETLAEAAATDAAGRIDRSSIPPSTLELLDRGSDAGMDLSMPEGTDDPSGATYGQIGIPGSGERGDIELPEKEEVASYIRSRAPDFGVHPDVAVTVAASEGLSGDPREAWQSRIVSGGKREESFGPFQLYTGGGLGNKFMKETGLDPRDPYTWREQIDFSLREASQGGWGPWHGAQRVGISEWEGINAAPTRASSPVAGQTAQRAPSQRPRSPEPTRRTASLGSGALPVSEPASERSSPSQALEEAQRRRLASSQRTPTALPVDLPEIT